MGLDFHVAKSKAAAIKSYPDLSMDEASHRELFFNSKNPIKLTKLLGRLTDYYQDAVFSLVDLPEFLGELNRIKIESKTNFQTHLIAELIRVSEKAIAEQKDIYVFCD